MRTFPFAERHAMHLTSILSANGQLVLPAAVLNALGLQRGDQVAFVPVQGGYTLMPESPSIKSLKGCLAPFAEPASLAEMEEAVAISAVEGEVAT
jgi:bifunctional DNA-binding transcriptional regulator/antitoxin component of YhaV-PrlF toxin-antitoxin module